MSNRKDRAKALAARSRFWIDDLHVQPDRCVVMREKDEIRLELRMMEVLVMLAEHAGETITKEKLLVDVWGNEIYGDSPVNKVISRLRDLIGDDARKARYIETVSKVGFRMIAAVTLPEDYRRMPAKPWKEGSPYVGLSAYDASHTSVFCGRGRSIGDLLRAMRIQMENNRRLVMIVGASGCGKTSLLRAGAIPLLRKPDGFEGLHALSVAGCDLAAAHAGDPMTPLVAAVATWTIDDRPVFPPQTTEQLRSQLIQKTDSIAGLIGEAFRMHSRLNIEQHPYAHLLLTIDHAETLVTYHDIDTKAQEAFERLIIALCECPHVLVTMITRSDFYAKMTESFPSLAERKAGDGHVDILPPRFGEIGEIIRTPAWRANLSFEMDPDSRDRLDDVLRDAAVSQPDALPLLQHTLDTLYERCKEKQLFTFAAYHQIGGLEGAIAHRAKEVFSSLPASAQNSLDSVLTRIIVVQDDSDFVSARRPYADDFADGAKALVEGFIAARLFVGDHRDGRATIGVAHEALLRRWPQAVEWVQENRRLLIAKERLKRAAERWVREGQQDDHLLNPGRQLEDGWEAARRFNADISERDILFLASSQRLASRKRVLKRTAIALLATMTLTSTVMAAALFNSLEESRKSNRKAQDFSDLVFNIADDLQKTGNGEALENISEATISSMTGISITSDSPDDLINASRANALKGSIMFNMGKRKDALAAFNNAYVSASKATQLSPRSDRARAQAGQAAYWLGHYHYDEKDYPSARKFWGEYRREYEILHDRNPEDYGFIVELSYAFDNLGSLSEKDADPASALDNYDNSLKFKRMAMSMNHIDDELAYETIVTNSKRANARLAVGELLNADAEYTEAIRELDVMTSKNDSANEWKKQLSNLLQIKSRLSVLLGNLESAESEITRSIKILSDIIEENQRHADWRQYLIMSHYDAAEVLRLKHDPRASYHLDQAEHHARLAQSEEGLSLQLKRTLIGVRVARALIEVAPSRIDQLDQGIVDLRSLARDRPDDIHTAIALARGLIARGDSHYAKSELEQSRACWREAKSILERLGKRGNDPRVTGVWSIATERLGEHRLSMEKRLWLTKINYRHPEFVASPGPPSAAIVPH
jgi:DNA-binding winged helix-turn-helix (wHTH) protein/tetratricopeptide (TPR) repeat protein